MQKPTDARCGQSPEWPLNSPNLFQIVNKIQRKSTSS